MTLLCIHLFIFLTTMESGPCWTSTLYGTSCRTSKVPGLSVLDLAITITLLQVPDRFSHFLLDCSCRAPAIYTLMEVWAGEGIDFSQAEGCMLNAGFIRVCKHVPAQAGFLRLDRFHGRIADELHDPAEDAIRGIEKAIGRLFLT